MASTYSSLKFELPGNGEQTLTWGTTTNTNVGTAIEQAISGYGSAQFTADSNLTLDYLDTNASQVFRNLVLNVTSFVPLTATRNLIIPAIQKQYFIFNNTTGGQSILVKTAAGTGVTVPNGAKAVVYCDGGNVVDAFNYVTSLVSPALTGIPTAPTATVGTATTQIATTAFVAATAFSAILPGQTGNAGNFLTTNGTNASWAAVLPSQTGNSGRYLTTNGTTASWGVVPSASFTEFTSSGTWTKPAGANFVMVELWGAGGGGGSGVRSGIGGSNLWRGGGGGGGGAYAYRVLKASDLGSTETVTIGAGGTGGAAVTVDSTFGNPGTSGGNTSFGSWLTAYGGGLGGGGASFTNVGGGNGGGVLSASGDPSISAASGSGQFGSGALASGFGGGSGGGNNNSGGSSYQGGPGGGGGGAISNGSNTNQASGSGGGISGSSGTGAQGLYVYAGTNGTAGTGRQGGSGGAAGYQLQSRGQNVAFGNGTFALVTAEDWTASGAILTSTNGTNNWTFAQTPNGFGISHIVHDGTQFVLINQTLGRLWTTTNFSTFTERGTLPTAAIAGLNALRFANSNYFLCTNSGLFQSSNLSSWSAITTGLSNVRDICWSGTNYVAASTASPFVRYSANLSTWASATGSFGSSSGAASNGSGTVVITASLPAQQAMRSTDNGQTFTAVATTLPTSSASLTFVNATYFYTTSGELWTSTDGNTWTQRVTGTWTPTGSVAFDGTTFVASNNTTSANQAYTAVPASLGTWTARTTNARDVAGGAGGAGGTPGGGGGGGGPSNNGQNSGAGGNGGNGLARIYVW